ncbi:MAG: hypothetical protein AB8H80_02035 [Planctomycetota bacterium]
MRATILLFVAAAAITAAMYLGGWDTSLPPNPAAEANAGAPTMESTARHSPSESARSIVDADLAASNPRERMRPDAAHARPLPPDATWVEVQLIDPDGEPVGGGEVLWFDDTSYAEAHQAVGRDYLLMLFEQDPLAERFGWRTQADEHGVARLARREGATIIGRTNGLRGSRQITTTTPTDANGRVRLELRPSRTLRVHVTDATGMPAAGVPLALLFVDTEGKEIWAMHGMPMAKSDERGHAVLSAMRRWQRWQAHETATGSYRAAYVKAAIPGLVSEGVVVPELAAATHADAVLHLQLPPLGAARVRTAPDVVTQQPEQTQIFLTLANMDSDRFGRSLHSPCEADGWAHFPYLPLGVRFLAEDGFAVLEAEFDSPTTAGETVDCIVHPKDGTTCLRMRLVDHRNRPLVHQFVNMQWWHGDASHWTMFHTDQHGQGVVSIEEDEATAEKGQPAAVHIQFEPENEDVIGSATVQLHEFPRGSHDLGDIRIQRPPAFASGNIVDERGNACSVPISLTVERQRLASEDAAEPWQEVDAAFSSIDRGQFVIYFQQNVSRQRGHRYRYRLSAEGDDVVTKKTVPLRKDDHSIRIVIKTGRHLGIELLLPGGAPTDHLICQLTSRDGQRGGHDSQRLRATPILLDSSLHEVLWRGLPVGIYHLDIRLWGDSAPVYTADGIRLVDAGGIAHMDFGQPIDLRDALEVVSFNFRPTRQQAAFDEARDKPLDGNPRIYSGLVAYASSLTLNPVPAFEATNEDAQLLLRRNSAPLVALLRGHLPAPVTGTGRHRESRNRERKTLRMQVSLPAAELVAHPLPRGIKIRARATSVAPEGRKWAAPWGEQPLAPYLGSGTRWIDLPITENTTTSQARISVGEGTHDLEVQLFEGRQSASLLEKPLRITAAAGDIQIRVSPEAWRRAVHAIQPQASHMPDLAPRGGR